jgi:hypothetical protein
MESFGKGMRVGFSNGGGRGSPNTSSGLRRLVQRKKHERSDVAAHYC